MCASGTRSESMGAAVEGQYLHNQMLCDGDDWLTMFCSVIVKYS